MDSLSLEQLNERKESLIGMAVSVQGVLIVTANGCAFVSNSYDEFVDEQRMRLEPSDEVMRWCMANLAAYGGGQCMFMERAVVNGTLRIQDDQCWLDNLHGCVLDTDAGLVVIPLGG